MRSVSYQAETTPWFLVFAVLNNLLHTLIIRWPTQITGKHVRNPKKICLSDSHLAEVTVTFFRGITAHAKIQPNMIPLPEFFLLNREIILFFYGLVFFILGFAIVLQTRQSSLLYLAPN